MSYIERHPASRELILYRNILKATLSSGYRGHRARGVIDDASCHNVVGAIIGYAGAFDRFHQTPGSLASFAWQNNRIAIYHPGQNIHEQASFEARFGAFNLPIVEFENFKRTPRKIIWGNNLGKITEYSPDFSLRERVTRRLRTQEQDVRRRSDIASFYAQMLVVQSDIMHQP